MIIGIAGNCRSRKFTRTLVQVFKENEALPVISLTVPWSGYLLPEVRLSVRLNSAIGYVAPVVKLERREKQLFEEREKKLETAREKRRGRRRQVKLADRSEENCLLVNLN